MPFLTRSGVFWALGDDAIADDDGGDMDVTDNRPGRLPPGGDAIFIGELEGASGILIGCVCMPCQHDG